jgi:hypothetical protein
MPVSEMKGLAQQGETVLFEEWTFTQTSGAGLYTATVNIPAYATILDIIIQSLALWTGTSASLIVGDAADPDGFYLATDLVATDLLVGEDLSFGHPGGLAGAYIASEQRVRTKNAARSVIAVITQVGTGTAGRTRMGVMYAAPDAVENANAAVKV